MEKKNLFDLLFEKPVAFIAATFPYLLVVVVGLGLYFISNLDVIARNQFPAKMPDSTVAADLEVVHPTLAPGIDLKTITTPSADMIAKGKDLFTNNCQTCHGAIGKGDGPAGVALNPKPRNFSATDGWKNGRNIGDMFGTLDKGIAATGMPQFNQLTPEQRLNILHYVRSTFMNGGPIVTADQLSKFDADYKLSAGTGVPGQIPTSSASNLVIKRQSEKAAKVKEVVAKLNELKKSEKIDRSLAVFLMVASNQEKAVNTLVNSNDWAQSEAAFRTVVAGNLVINGFSGKTLSLSDDDFRALYGLMKSLVKA